MQLRFFAAALIFLGSYFPLSIILLVQDINYCAFNSAQHISELQLEIGVLLKNPSISITIAAISLVCFLVSIVILQFVRPKILIELTGAKYVPADLMNYTLPYIVSFMNFDYQETGKFIGFLIFLVWMFLISYRSGQVILNPLLIVFGWRLYELKYKFAADNKEQTSQALSKNVLEIGMHCNQRAVQDILIVKPIVEESSS